MSCEPPTYNGKLTFHRASLLDRLRHDNRLVHFFFARECAAQTILVRRNAPRSARHNNAENQQRLHHFEALAEMQQNKDCEQTDEQPPPQRNGHSICRRIADADANEQAYCDAKEGMEL